MAARVIPFFLSASVYNLLDIHNWPKFPQHSTPGYPRDPSACILNVGVLYVREGYGAKGVVAAVLAATSLAKKVKGEKWCVKVYLTMGLQLESPLALQQHQISEERPLRLGRVKGQRIRETKNCNFLLSVPRSQLERGWPTDLWDSVSQVSP